MTACWHGKFRLLYMNESFSIYDYDRRSGWPARTASNALGFDSQSKKAGTYLLAGHVMCPSRNVSGPTLLFFSRPHGGLGFSKIVQRTRADHAHPVN